MITFILMIIGQKLVSVISQSGRLKMIDRYRMISFNFGDKRTKISVSNITIRKDRNDS